MNAANHSRQRMAISVMDSVLLNVQEGMPEGTASISDVNALRLPLESASIRRRYTDVMGLDVRYARAR